MTHVCGQHAGIIKIACCVADFGSIHVPRCGKSEFRRARVRVCPNWAANPNTSYRIRDGPHLCPASLFTSPSTQVSVCLFNELNYSKTLESLYDKHPPYAEKPYFASNGFCGKSVYAPAAWISENKTLQSCQHGAGTQAPRLLSKTSYPINMRIPIFYPTRYGSHSPYISTHLTSHNPTPPSTDLLT
jgi:hypothetical protein